MTTRWQHCASSASAVMLTLSVAIAGVGPQAGAADAAGRDARDGAVSAPAAARTTAPTPPPVRAPKKGVSLWEMDGVDRALRASGATWWWNWDVEPHGVTAMRSRFVPMLWGSGSLTPERLAAVDASGARHLLAFNEPDHTDQSDMSPEQALDLWPQLEATGLRLSSPAVAEHGATPGGWLDRFMTGARQRGLRVDFIALHWYGSDFDPARASDQLRDYVTAVHQRYRKPIWVTEYGLMGFADGGVQTPDPATQAAFIESSTTMLESLPFVRRYAWFSLPALAPWPATGLFRPGGAPTPQGLAYARAGRPR